MFLSVEVEQTHPNLRWMDLGARDTVNDGETTIRVAIDEAPKMLADFLERYMAKCPQSFEAPNSQARQLEDFFEEAVMARAILQKGNVTNDLVVLLPTTYIDFTYSEKSSFRKSKQARVQLFLDDAMHLLDKRNFPRCLQRLGWIHHLNPAHELAFELKVVCLRSWKKPAECVSVFEAWTQAWPDQVEPRLGMGELWLYLEQYQRAATSFKNLLEIAPNNCQGLIGLAQARLKLGEDPLPDLRKARIVDGHTTQVLVENGFDFRSRKPQNLRKATLEQIAEEWQIPLKRVLQRAETGALPCFLPEEGDPDGLLRFEAQDMATYRKVLEVLGIEIRISMMQPTTSMEEHEGDLEQEQRAVQDLTQTKNQSEGFDTDTELVTVIQVETGSVPKTGKAEPKVIQPSLFDD